MLIDINTARARVESLIIKNDTRWQWDDNNFSTLPIGYAKIKNGQQDYGFDVSMLKVQGARVKDPNGNWNVLTPIDESQPDYNAIMRSGSTGTPTHYDKRGSSIFLGPIPNYEQELSLEITCQRAGIPFSAGDLTNANKYPGFNSLYHELLALWPSYDYWLPKKQEKSQGFLQKITLFEDGLAKDYNRRSKDERGGLRVLEEDSE